MGKVLVVVGVIVAGIGLMIMAGVPLGRLPGDFIIRRGNATLYFPLATSVIVSIILTLLLGFLRR